MVEFVVGLTDKVSGPAKQAAASLANVGKSAGGLRGALKSLEMFLGTASQGRNELGQFTEKLGPLTSILDAFPHPLLKVIATLGAVAMAFAAAGVAAVAWGAKMSLEAAQFKAEALAAFTALTGTAKAGEDTLNIIREVGRLVPETEAQLIDAAKGLLASGLDPQRLKSTLLSMSAIAAAIGESGAKKLEGIINKTLTSGKFEIKAKQLIGTGVSMNDLAKQLGMTPAAFKAAMKQGTIGAQQGIDALNKLIQERLGGALEDKMLSLGAISNKFHDNIRHLFEDVNVKPFLAGIKSLAGIFDQSTASGKAMKFLVTAAFNGIFAVASKVFPYVRAFMLGLVIAGLKVYIALKPAVAQLQKLMGGTSSKGTMDALFALAGATMAPIVAFINMATMIAGAMATVYNVVIHVYDEIKAQFAGAGEIATNFVQGLVNGISSGTGMVVDAVRALGQGAMTALKGILGIASPSKEMAKLGKFTAMGFSGGLDDHMPDIGDSMKAAGALPSVGGGGGGGGGNTFNIEVTVTAGGDAKSIAEGIEQELAIAFERLALTQGLAT